MVLCMALFAIMSTSVILSVVLRYTLDSGFLWVQDLALFSFGLLAILSIPCAFSADKHVRVDVLRQGQEELVRQRIDFIGIFAFAFPMFFLLLFYGWGDVAYSILIGEGSPQIGGLPFFYLVKAGLPLACILMFFQGAAILLNNNLTTKIAR